MHTKSLCRSVNKKLSSYADNKQFKRIDKFTSHVRLPSAGALFGVLIFTALFISANLLVRKSFRYLQLTWGGSFFTDIGDKCFTCMILLQWIRLEPNYNIFIPATAFLMFIPNSVYY